MNQKTVSFPTAIKKAFSNYANFRGRASRSEYWWFALFSLLSVIFLALTSVIIFHEDAYYLAWLWLVVLLVPNLSIMARRLHDTNRSTGWLAAFGLTLVLSFLCLALQVDTLAYVAVIGIFVFYAIGIWLLILALFPSYKAENVYGPVPNSVDAERKPADIVEVEPS